MTFSNSNCSQLSNNNVRNNRNVQPMGHAAVYGPPKLRSYGAPKYPTGIICNGYCPSYYSQYSQHRSSSASSGGRHGNIVSPDPIIGMSHYKN